MKTFEQQIELFKEQTDLQLEIVDGKPYYDGNIHIHNNNTNAITFPDSLVVNGDLNVSKTEITELPRDIVVKGDLDISFTEIKELPEDIVIGGSLYAEKSSLEKLPSSLKVVNGNLYVNYTSIDSLPENLTIGGYLNVGNTEITQLPEDIVIGGGLYAENTSLEKLPENLKVGGRLCLRNSMVKELPSGLEVVGDIYVSEHIKDGMEECEFDRLNKLLLNDSYKKDYIEWVQETTGRKFCKADGIFTEILEEKGNVKVVREPRSKKELYLVTDGDGNYAHGYTIQEAKDDLIYKISNRDKSDYENLTLDSVLTHKEAIKCYRVITGACSAGTKSFVENTLGSKKKDKYTIQEMIDLTKGQFGNEEFVKFFKP